MIVIDKGRKIAEGNVSEMLDPAITILEVQTLDDARCLELIRGSSWSTGLQDIRTAIRLRIDKADVPRLASWLVEQGVAITALQPKHSLEEYFLSITNPGHYVEPVSN